MSGVYIERMEMPKSCNQCWFYGFGPKDDPYCWLLKGNLPLPDRIPQDCPLTPVAERKKGNWINQRADSEMCSSCGVRFYISALFAVGGNDEPPYCPNCEADMRKEQT